MTPSYRGDHAAQHRCVHGRASRRASGRSSWPWPAAAHSARPRHTTLPAWASASCDSRTLRSSKPPTSIASSPPTSTRSVSTRPRRWRPSWRRINPETRASAPSATGVNESSIAELLDGADVVVDGLDFFEPRRPSSSCIGRRAVAASGSARARAWRRSPRRRASTRRGRPWKTWSATRAARRSPRRSSSFFPVLPKATTPELLAQRYRRRAAVRPLRRYRAPPSGARFLVEDILRIAVRRPAAACGGPRPLRPR